MEYKHVNTNSENNKQKIEFWALTLIISISFTVFFYQIWKYMPERNFSFISTLNFFEVFRITECLKILDFVSIFDSDIGPLTSFIMIVPYKLMNLGIKHSVFLLNLIFLVFSVLGIYSLTRHFSNHRAGLFAVVILALNPLLSYCALSYTFDYYILAFSILTYLFLIKSDSFNNRTWTLNSAIIIGFGLHIRIQFAAYIIGFIVFILFENFVLSNRIRKKNIQNIIIFILIIFIIVLPRLIPEKRLLNELFLPFMDPDLTAWYNPGRLNLHLKGLWQVQLGIPLFALFLISFIPFVRNSNRKAVLLVASWISIPVLILIFMPHFASARYTLPILPAYIIVAVCGIEKILRGRYYRILIIIWYLMGGFYLYTLFFNNDLFPKNRFFRNSIADRFKFTYLIEPIWINFEDKSSTIQSSLYESIDSALLKVYNQQTENKDIQTILYSTDNSLEFYWPNLLKYYVLQDHKIETEIISTDRYDMTIHNRFDIFIEHIEDRDTKVILLELKISKEKESAFIDQINKHISAYSNNAEFLKFPEKGELIFSNQKEGKEGIYAYMYILDKSSDIFE